VLAEWDEKQISTETTFDIDIDNVGLLRAELLQLADRTASRLRKRQLTARGIALKVRRHDFHTFTRQRHCQPATNDSRIVGEVVLQLLTGWLAEHPGAAVRLLGVGAYELGPISQLSLFDATDEKNSLAPAAGTSRLDLAIDTIRDKFGVHAVLRASGLRTRETQRD
jgi:DNA polymerase-4